VVGGLENQEVGRFSEKEVLAFNSSREGRTLVWIFFVFALFFMWPYQTMVQMQSFLVKEFPEKGAEAGATMLLFTTWPLLITHALLSVTGIIRRLPYVVKITVPCVVVALLAVILVAVVLSPSTSPDFLLRSLYAAALIESVGQSLVEPAVFDMAGLMPSALASQGVQAGNGACGLVVSCVQMLTRLAANGLAPIGKKELEVLTVGFLAIMGFTGVSMVTLYFQRVRQSSYYLKYVERQDPHENIESEQVDLSEGCAEQQDATLFGHCADNVRNIAKALRYVFPSFMAVFLTYCTSMTLWPVIPGASCVAPRAGEFSPEPDQDNILQSWWFDLVLLCFNFSDFVGKSLRKSLQWGTQRLSPATQLLLAGLRAVVFVPIILACSAPQSFDPRTARWINLSAVFFLGISNGWLSTVCFMRAPRALPRGTSNAVAEQASSVLVLGLYLGLSTGCLIADQLGKTVLQEYLGACYQPMS